MTFEDETSGDMVQSVWHAHHHHSDLDEECSPTKPCRNMRDITFDGYAEPGSDLGAAWRALLAREGKLDPAGGSLRQLVLGNDEQT